jgi:hypothetical protein
VSNILGTLYLFSIAQIAINIAFLYKEQHIELVIISIIYLLLIGAAEFSIISNTIKEGKISNNIATLLFCLTLLFEGIAIYFYFKNGHILQVIQYAVLGIITLIATIYVFNKTRKKKEIQGKNMVNGLDRNNSSKKNWINVLDEIWQHAPHKYNKDNNNSNPLAQKLKISGNKLMVITSFLEEQKLIEYDNNQLILITSKGFDVALKNSTNKRNIISSRVTSILSLVIALLALDSLFFSITDICMAWLIAISIGIFIIIGTVIITKIIK